MSAHLLSSPDKGIFDVASGQWVSEKFQRIAELVNEFDPTLELQWIPPESRDPQVDKKPYRIIQKHPDIDTYVVMTIAENELDHRVLAALFDARDMADGEAGSLARRLENAEAAAEAVRLKAWGDQLAEAREKAMFLVRTPYHTVKMDGKKYHL